MFFDTKRLTKKQLREQICFFAKQTGVSKVIFNDKAKYVSGTFNGITNIMYISLNLTKKQMLCTLFHELGHFHAIQQRKWIKYHFNLYKTPNVNTFFSIENKIEKISKKLWDQNVSRKQWGNYKYFYLKSKQKEIIKTLEATR